MNSYSYARNNPVLYNDPTGEDLASSFWLAINTTSDVVGGAVYAFVNNYTYGQLSRTVDAPDNTATNVGQIIGDAATYAASAAEIAGGALIAGGGAVLSPVAIVGAPVTAGATVVADAAAIAGGAAMMAHGGTVAGYMMSKGMSSGGLKVNMNKQGKHIPGHKNFDPAQNKSTFTHNNPQKLIDDFAGTGTPINNTPRGQAGFKEVIDFKEKIGTYINKEGTIRLPTSKGIIHYSKKDVHIVPANPN